jgi:hypothetical protein
VAKRKEGACAIIAGHAQRVRVPPPPHPPPHPSSISRHATYPHCVSTPVPPLARHLQEVLVVSEEGKEPRPRHKLHPSPLHIVLRSPIRVAAASRNKQRQQSINQPRQHAAVCKRIRDCAKQSLALEIPAPQVQNKARTVACTGYCQGCASSVLRCPPLSTHARWPDGRWGLPSIDPTPCGAEGARQTCIPHRLRRRNRLHDGQGARPRGSWRAGEGGEGGIRGGNHCK